MMHVARRMGCAGAQCVRLRALLPQPVVGAQRCMALDTRAAAALEDGVTAALRGVQDPVLCKDVVTLGYVKNVAAEAADKVRLDIQLPTPAHPSKSAIQRSARDAVLAAGLPGIAAAGNVDVRITTRPRRARGSNASKGSQRVANIIAVSSCKGGTGKSTVAVNLAYTLASSGALVGIFDADLYGPSLPALISPPDTNVYKSEEEGTINPLTFCDVKAMSYGYVAPVDKTTGERGTAVVRGPIASNITQQMVNFTDWGELDYLIVDLPPGTGDINLTLCQQLPMAAAVVVTTPHKLSYIDVVKGIAMFDKLKVPTLALVENMSYFECEHGTKYHPFGTSHKDTLIDTYGFKATASIPIHADLAMSAQVGWYNCRPMHVARACGVATLTSIATPPTRRTHSPLVVSDPDHAISKLYQGLADSLIAELLRLQFKAAGAAVTSVSWNKQAGAVVVRQFGDDGATEDYLHPRLLRQSCQCAACVDEYTGRPLLDPATIAGDVEPVSIETKGNYAVGVTWSDGHTSSIYKYETLHDIVKHSKDASDSTPTAPGHN